ncbi:MAG: hypothetical protein DMD35_00545 [Gemmatimonadetes bacterium]|nr:MAG: hypothetical protein DMD35_00545 [Gemmatimonadota bacterium]
MPRARRRAACRARALALALVVTACGKGAGRATDSTRAASPPATGSASTQTARAGSTTQDARTPACPRTGHWIDCQVHERLIRSGLAPRDTTRDALPALGPSPIVYRLGKGGLAVYLFADSTTRARAATTLDTVKFVRAPRGPTVLSQATVIENDNLLGLLFSKNEQQIERVSDALTAGPPQP